MRIWGKLIKNRHKTKDLVVEYNDQALTRTKKIFAALEDICHEFDLQVPIWLDVNIKEFKMYSKTRFTSDSFIEAIDFDYLEFQVIEED